MEKGHKVIVVVAYDKYGLELEKICTKVIYTKIHRGAFSLISDFKLIVTLKNLYNNYDPLIVHHFNAKPVILGSIAAKLSLANVKVINTITGLGHAFIKSIILKFVVIIAYKISLKMSSEIVFQNDDDYKFFKRKKLVPINLGLFIPGAGVNLKKFLPKKKYNKNINVYFIGRLIWQKGFKEFLEISISIKKNYNNVFFHVVGEIDSKHPDSIDLNELKKYEKNNVIQYHGYKNNMNKVYQNADIVLFLSYREGFPRVVLEASASGIPSIGFKVPGVKEAIIDNETGFLVNFKDLDAIYKKLELLIKDKALRKKLGDRARKIAEEKFSLVKITDQYLDLYKNLGL